MRILSIDIARFRTSVGRTTLPLSTLEQFYYRYFAERVMKGLGPAITGGTAGAPQGFHETIRRFESERLPDREEATSRRRSLTIGTFRTTISRINTKILQTLGQRTGAAYQIRVDGPRNGRSYALSLRKSQLRITSSNVGDLFGKAVRVLTIERPLTDALDAIRDDDFTQIVIRVNGELKLLTIEGIARWMAGQPRTPILPLDGVTIGDVFKYERKDNMKCIDAGVSILDARTYFANRLDSTKPNLVALIITHTGKPTGTPLGIITAADFLNKRYW